MSNISDMIRKIEKLKKSDKKEDKEKLEKLKELTKRIGVSPNNPIYVGSSSQNSSLPATSKLTFTISGIGAKSEVKSLEFLCKKHGLNIDYVSDGALLFKTYLVTITGDVYILNRIKNAIK